MIQKSYAKLNIFLKIVGQRGRYHNICSRFIAYKELFDTISFVPKKAKSDTFGLVGDFGCNKEQNTITKAYHALQNFTKSKELEAFFKAHSVHVNKNIPEFAGLGGGSSNGATFLLMCNEFIKLNLEKKTLANIGLEVGADVPFFIYGFKSANVSGIGEVVEEFQEELPEFEVLTPKVKVSTRDIFEHFRENFLNQISKKNSLGLQGCTTKTVLETFDPLYINDLYKSAILKHCELENYLERGWFMSGSGSSMFRMKNG